MKTTRVQLYYDGHIYGYYRTHWKTAEIINYTVANHAVFSLVCILISYARKTFNSDNLFEPVVSADNPVSTENTGELDLSVIIVRDRTLALIWVSVQHEGPPS